MKNNFILFLTCILTSYAITQNDPTIMEVDGEKVRKSEFLQIYLKNNNDPQYDKASLDEYMVLFKKFKLKVAEAEALGYDTIPRLKKELEGYRKQLATPYLTDSTMNEALVKEAYERISSEIRASHILLRLAPDATPKDTAAVYARLMKLRKEILAGADFTAVAKGKTGSEDPSVAQNGGDLGYFTAFQMVTPFEDAAYNTPVGEISMPIRTKFGYHIVKVMDKRPARGTINAAHIMISKAENEGQDMEASLLATKKIDEIYEKLQQGENFEELVGKFSDDPSTNTKAGVLPTFGSGTSTRMVPNFEDAAFALQKDGEYSKPIETEYGWHIIKRISWLPLPAYDKMKKELQSKVSRDDRAKRTQDSFVKKLKVNYAFKKKSDSRVDYFKTQLDCTFFEGGFKASSIKKNKVIYKIDGKKVRQADFAKYLEKNYRSISKQYTETAVDQLYKNFEKDQILAYEESKLDEKYPAFKSLMQEYHDGILLYEVMSDKVWNRAMRDSTGLNTFFENNRDAYQWGTRYDAIVYECANTEIANRVSEMIQNDTLSAKEVLAAINKDSELNLKVKNNKFEVENTPFLKDQKLTTGKNAIYEHEGKYYVVDVLEILPAGPKELKEAKGAVTSDYQNFLEKEWMDELTKKHPIVVYNEVLYSLGK